MPLDEPANKRARRRHGLVLGAELGDHPTRAAQRLNLVPLHHGVFVAATQPLTASVALASLRATTQDRRVVVLGEAALWIHGVADAPAEVVVGVPLGSTFALCPPLRTRRVADWVLEGSRTLDRCQVVALETAVIQVAAERSVKQTRDLVEGLVRDRRTTLARLRARCRRGLKGSARVRAVCDELAGGSMDADVRRLKAALEARGATGLRTEVRFTSTSGASAYADLFHEETRTAFEVDGLVEHSRRTRFRADRRRDRWMKGEHAVTTLRIDVLEIREDLDALADELAPFVVDPDLPRSA